MPVWGALIFAVAFGGTALGLFLGLLLPNIREARLVNDTSITPIQVTVIAHQGGMSINEVPHFRLVLEFNDGSGRVMRTGYWFINPQSQHPVGATRYARVRGDNIAVLGTYPATSDVGLWIFVSVFGAVGLGFAIATIVIVKNRVKAAAMLAMGGGMVAFSQRNSNPTAARIGGGGFGAGAFGGNMTAAQRRTFDEEMYRDVHFRVLSMQTGFEMRQELDANRNNLTPENYYRILGEITYVEAGKLLPRSNRRPAHPSHLPKPTPAQQRKLDEDKYNEVLAQVIQMQNKLAKLSVVASYRAELINQNYFRILGEIDEMTSPQD